MVDEKNDSDLVAQPRQNIRFIVSDDKEPKIKVGPNTKVELIELKFENTDGATNKDVVLATLCGWGSTYCLALVEY